MAKPVPLSTYREIEWHLHNTAELRKLIQGAYDDILYGSKGTDFNNPHVKSLPADHTGKKALLLAEGTPEMRKIMCWLAVIKATREYYATAPEGALIQRFYGRGVSIQAAAEAIKVSRQTVGRMRDHVVYRCAMLAATKGLIRSQDLEPDGEEEEEP